MVLALALAGCGAEAAVAQDDGEVRAAVDRIFDGMRAADADMVRSGFADDVRFARPQEGGQAPIAFSTLDGFLTAVAGSEGRWDEQIYDVEVRVDGPMASVWAPFTFYLDGAISHCGVNSMELLREPDGWKVTQISDTRRTEGCPDPLGSR
jgi:hypothetical protein